jgi:hypothetical protein
MATKAELEADLAVATRSREHWTREAHQCGAQLHALQERAIRAEALSHRLLRLMEARAGVLIDQGPPEEAP